MRRAGVGRELPPEAVRQQSALAEHEPFAAACFSLAPPPMEHSVKTAGQRSPFPVRVHVNRPLIERAAPDQVPRVSTSDLPT